MKKRPCLCRLCEGSRGFTLLEGLLSGSLTLLVTVFFFSVLLSYFTMCERTIAQIELSETIMTTEYALFQFCRYSSSANILSEGKRVKLSFAQNGIEIYPTKATLVVLNKGSANPLAEGCGEKTGFTIENSSQSRQRLKVYIPFSYGKRNEELSLEIGVCFWKK